MCNDAELTRCFARHLMFLDVLLLTEGATVAASPLMPRTINAGATAIEKRVSPRNSVLNATMLNAGLAQSMGGTVLKPEVHELARKVAASVTSAAAAAAATTDDQLSHEAATHRLLTEQKAFAFKAIILSTTDTSDSSGGSAAVDDSNDGRGGSDDSAFRRDQRDESNNDNSGGTGGSGGARTWPRWRRTWHSGARVGPCERGWPCVGR